MIKKYINKGCRLNLVFVFFMYITIVAQGQNINICDYTDKPTEIFLTVLSYLLLISIIIIGILTFFDD